MKKKTYSGLCIVFACIMVCIWQPCDGQDRSQTKEELIKKADRYYERDDYNKVVSTLAAVLEKELSKEESHQVCSLRAMAYIGLKDLVNAERNINAAIKRKRTDANSYRLRAYILKKGREYKAALKDYDQAITIDPYNARIYEDRGKLKLYDLKYFYSSISDFTKALKLDPKRSINYFYRGLAYYKTVDYARAVRDFAEYLDHMPYRYDKFGRKVEQVGPGARHIAYARLHTRYFDENGKMMQISHQDHSDVGYSIKSNISQHYNRACVLALYNMRTSALGDLESALELGYKDFDQLQSEIDLYSIMYSEKFRLLLEKHGAKVKIKKQSEFIRDFVVANLEDWKIRREFETKEEYKLRIKNTRDREEVLSTIAVKYFKDKHRQSIDFRKFIIHPYNADKQLYPVEFEHAGTINLNIPREYAENFKKYQSEVQFINPDFELKKDKWMISYLEVINGHDKATFTYGGINQNNYTPPVVEASIKDENTNRPKVVKEHTSILSEDYYDIGSNLPHNKIDYSNALAVVIGNKDYAHFNDVDFAINDAMVMKKYLLRVLGFPSSNVRYVPNARVGEFQKYFGVKGDNNGWLKRNTTDGETDVFIFYSGHGAPGLNDKKGYFVPVECELDYVEQQGYPLDVFYENLGALSAKSKTVIIDACFSGANVYKGISGVLIKPRTDYKMLENTVVLTSSTGTQVSSWYTEKKHGLLTYFFLKAIHGRNADENKDRKLTFNEVFIYISDKKIGIPAYARRKGREQDPTIQGNDKDRVLIRY